MEKEPEILSSKLIHKGWLKLIVDKLKLHHIDKPYYYDVVKINNGVAVLPFLDMETLLLAEQYLHPAKKYFLEPIQGGIKKGESYEDAARRELLEDTGYVGDLHHLTSIYPLPAAIDMELNFFFVTNIKKIQEPQLDKFESLRIVEKDYSNVVEGVLSGEHKDGALQLLVRSFDADKISYWCDLFSHN
ncbi:MAG: NUDIX hydrolase [archaeon]